MLRVVRIACLIFTFNWKMKEKQSDLASGTSVIQTWKIPLGGNMVCNACKGVVHQGQPKNCKGGTWCDCLHRLPTEIITTEVKEETND